MRWRGLIEGGKNLTALKTTLTALTKTEIIQRLRACHSPVEFPDELCMMVVTGHPFLLLLFSQGCLLHMVICLNSLKRHVLVFCHKRPKPKTCNLDRYENTWICSGRVFLEGYFQTRCFLLFVLTEFCSGRIIMSRRILSSLPINWISICLFRTMFYMIYPTISLCRTSNLSPLHKYRTTTQ